MQNVAMRERMFTMRLSEEESRRLDRIADHYGLNGAGAIRMLLKARSDELDADEQERVRIGRLAFGKAPPPQRPRKLGTKRERSGR